MLQYIIYSLAEQISVSVIVLHYKHEFGVEQTINSISSQNLENIELLVVDDGSTDKSLDNIYKLSQKFKNKKIIPNKNRIGFAKARVQAINLAQGSYVLFMYSGSVFATQNSLRLMFETGINNQNAQIVHGKANNNVNAPLIFDLVTPPQSQIQTIKNFLTEGKLFNIALIKDIAKNYQPEKMLECPDDLGFMTFAANAVRSYIGIDQVVFIPFFQNNWNKQSFNYQEELLLMTKSVTRSINAESGLAKHFFSQLKSNIQIDKLTPEQQKIICSNYQLIDSRGKTYNLVELADLRQCNIEDGLEDELEFQRLLNKQIEEERLKNQNTANQKPVKFDAKQVVQQEMLKQAKSKLTVLILPAQQQKMDQSIQNIQKFAQVDFRIMDQPNKIKAERVKDIQSEYLIIVDAGEEVDYQMLLDEIQFGHPDLILFKKGDGQTIYSYNKKEQMLSVKGKAFATTLINQEYELTAKSEELILKDLQTNTKLIASIEINLKQ
uniref:Glycosyl transferase family 2 protein n=1 Tax=Trepomonas sp. PC1 TaxID=1076344 RepID=A0A146KI99_9EUKA|eukprot:JAP96373.1 Glycosyl transferase family 2 protein [Trepomonas sp. PC1]